MIEHSLRRARANMKFRHRGRRLANAMKLVESTVWKTSFAQQCFEPTVQRATKVTRKQ